MRVTALGTSAAYPGPDNACTGWLVEEEDSRILVDCGTGVISRLQKVLPLKEVTAVVISHMHADHFFDLVPLRYAYKYALGVPDPQPILYLPPGGTQTLEAIGTTLDANQSGSFFSAVFDVREYDPASTLTLGPVGVQFAPGQHYIASWAMSLMGSRRVVFTADTGPSSDVEKLAQGADLLVSEATYVSTEEEQGGQRGHLTGSEAGELARRAEARRVLLTHHWPHRDPRISVQQAKEVFKGDLALAQSLRSYEV